LQWLCAKDSFIFNKINWQVTNPDVESLQPTSVFVRPPKINVKKFKMSDIIPGIEFVCNSKMSLPTVVELGLYPLSPNITKLLNKG